MFLLKDLPGCNPTCRACHYRDFSYSEQIEKKNAWVRTQFGQWSHLLLPIKTAPESEQLGYRSKAWMRANFDGRLGFGMFRTERVQSEGKFRWIPKFVNWDQCPIHHPSLTETVRKIRVEFEQTANKAFLSQSLVGIYAAIPDLAIITRQDESHYLKELNWHKLCAPEFERVFIHTHFQAGKKIWGHLPIVPVYLKYPTRLYPPIGIFRQTAKTLLHEARRDAAQFLSDQPLILDLYCGTGDFLNFLPKQTRWIGIEKSKLATLAFRNKENCEIFPGSIEARLKDPKVIEKISGNYGIYLNPPRSGISPEGMKAIENLVQQKRPKKIAYLSCSASSLKRDLNAFLKIGFHPIHLQPYDFFPQTEHFEILAWLT